MIHDCMKNKIYEEMSHIISIFQKHMIKEAMFYFLSGESCKISNRHIKVIHL